jgi:hypothetical protein
MATLIVPIADVSTNALPGTSVLARLSDIYGRPITGITVAGGYVVEPQLEYSDESGIATFELIPNDQMVQDNTFYSIKVAHYPPVIIQKTGATQTLSEAIATEPTELGPAATLDSLGDVEVDGAVTGDVLRKASSGFWEAYSLPSGSVPAYSHDQGVAATTWTVNHSLGRYPVIDVLDSTGRVLITQIQHNSLNQATVTLLTALTGKAECR